MDGEKLSLEDKLAARQAERMGQRVRQVVEDANFADTVQATKYPSSNSWKPTPDYKPDPYVNSDLRKKI